jgi:hypothetical protein
MAIIYFNKLNNFWKATNNSKIESWLDTKSLDVGKKITTTDNNYLDVITGRKIVTLNGDDTLNFVDVSDDNCSFMDLNKLKNSKGLINSPIEILQLNHPDYLFMSEALAFKDLINSYDLESFLNSEITIEGQVQKVCICHNFEDALRKNNKPVSFSHFNFA